MAAKARGSRKPQQRKATERKRAKAKQTAKRGRFVSVGRMVRAKYDAAQTTDNNRRHWANADALSANEANSLKVRKTLRERARYEIANNSFAKGMTDTLANDCIGSGPRLQVRTKQGKKLNDLILGLWQKWVKATKFHRKLWTLRRARTGDGEGFGMLASNPRSRFKLKLDIQLIECDRVTEPDKGGDDSIDGIVLDDFGNPVKYAVRKYHPGDADNGSKTDFKWVPAEYMIHLFNVDRPEQVRGIPDILPALPLFGQLRLYTLATLDAAQTAAALTALLKTTAPMEGDEDAEGVLPVTMDVIDMERNTALFLPEGVEPFQMKPEQPTATYPQFKREILNEASRALSMPYILAAGDSSGANFSSARLDCQEYRRYIELDREVVAETVLDPVFEAFVKEAVAAKLLPSALVDNDGNVDIPHDWYWAGWEQIDEVKAAQARDINLKNRMTTYRDEYDKKGEDWREQFEQIAAEKQAMSELRIDEQDIMNSPAGLGAPDGEAIDNAVQQAYEEAARAA